MKKAVFYGGGACLAVVVLAAVVLYVRLGSIVKSAVETWGARMTQAEVRLDSVSLSPFSSSGRIRGLFIGSPAGFKSPSAFKLDSVRMTVDPRSLLRRTVVIREIVVEGLEVTYEGSLSGSNLALFQKNLESFSSAAPAGGAQAEGRKVEIRSFKSTQGMVNLNLTVLGGKGMAVPLHDVAMHDIGRESGGVTLPEAAGIIFNAIAGDALKAAAGAGSALNTGAGMVQDFFRKEK